MIAKYSPLHLSALILESKTNFPVVILGLFEVVEVAALSVLAGMGELSLHL